MSSGQSGNKSRNSSSGDDDPVAIRLYARSIDAALDVATLESHGIGAEISGDTVGDTLNWYGLAVQKVELIVPRRKAAEAQQILVDRLAEQPESQRTDWICSGCGEVNGSEFDSRLSFADSVAVFSSAGVVHVLHCSADTVTDRSERTSRFSNAAPTHAMDVDRDAPPPVDAVGFPSASAKLLAAWSVVP